VRIEKTSASEPLMTCRKILNGVETRGVPYPWEEAGKRPEAVQPASGIKAA
jgi:hypothetical protein